MKCTIKAFGMTKDVLGNGLVEIEIDGGKTVGELRQVLKAQYPGLENLKSLFVAVNNEYASNEKELHEADEIALIPPVSGG